MRALQRRVAAGLTLIEVLVALVVVALAVVALVSSQTLTARMTRSAQLSTRATELAIEYIGMKTVEVQGHFDDLIDCPGENDCGGDADDGDFNVAWQFSRGGSPETDGLILIDIQVSGPATAQMSTYVSCMDFTYSESHPPPEGETLTPTIGKPGVCA